MAPRIFVLVIFLGFFAGLRAEQKPSVQYWTEQKDDLVIIHFSQGFPTLNQWDKLILLNIIQTRGKVLGSNIIQTETETRVSFLCDKADDPRVKTVLSLIKEGTKHLIRLREIQPPKETNRAPITPTRAPARVAFFI